MGREGIEGLEIGWYWKGLGSQGRRTWYVSVVVVMGGKFPSVSKGCRVAFH